MFIWGCIVGGIIGWYINESRFKRRALDYWETPQGKSKMSKKDLAEATNIGESHFAALEWVQYPSAGFLPFELLLFQWLHDRSKIEEFKKIDNLAYKSLHWRVVSYMSMLELNKREGLQNKNIRKEIQNTSNLEVAMMRWCASKGHVSFQEVIEKLGGYQDFGEYIESSDYPEAIKEMIFNTFIAAIKNK
jgi:elongation factor P hydroxylase